MTLSGHEAVSQLQVAFAMHAVVASKDGLKVRQAGPALVQPT